MLEANESVQFFVDLNECCAHLFNISMVLDTAAIDQKLSLPVWTPGSYMVREFAQHIVEISATQRGGQIDVVKINKNTFQLKNTGKEINVTYKVYGFDSSIRSAFIDSCQAFFNGTALFLRPHGKDNLPYLVKIARPAEKHFQKAEVATGLRKLDTDDAGFGSYHADNYDELVDHPFQISEMKRLHFDVLGTPHQIALVGDVRKFDEQRLTTDLAKLCENHISLFHGIAPFHHYMFIARFEEGGHGGLEHRNSSMLLSSPYDLPKRGMKDPDAHYRNFLSLCSHEYFHAWNVKRLKPASFIPLNFDDECYTTMLWIFEGITNYYDYLCVKRAGLISVSNYLDGIAKDVTRLLRNPGRSRQSLADSSFDAWIKFYRQNENSMNETVSYYLKGAFVAMYLDLTIRLQTNNNASLDDVMRKAVNQYSSSGLLEENFFALLTDIGKINIRDLRERFVYGTEDLPLNDLFSQFGVDCTLLPDETAVDDKSKTQSYLGLKLRFDDNERASISFVEKDGPAMQAGLSPFDEVVAINNIRLDSHNIADLLAGLCVNEPVSIMFARKKTMRHCSVVPIAPPLHICKLTQKSDMTQQEEINLQKWLGTIDADSNK